MSQQDEKQQLLNKIQREIAKLQKEFQELKTLKEAADEIKHFRKHLLNETQHYD